MTNISFVMEFQKVIKVLESCETVTHIQVTEKYFDLFLNKWVDSMSEYHRETLIHHFGKLKKNRLNKIQKNLNV